MARLDAILGEGYYVHVNIPLINMVNADVAVGGKSNFVSYVEEQNKSEEEKALARANIGLTDEVLGMSESVMASIEVGGITSGTNITEGTTLHDFVDMLVNPYQKPTISLSATFYDENNNNVGTQAEVNTNVRKVVLSAIVGKKSKAIGSVKFRLGGDVLATITDDVARGGTFTYTYTIDSGTIPSSAKFSAIATDEGDGSTTSGQQSISYVNYIYFKPKTTSAMVAPSNSLDIHSIGSPKTIASVVSVAKTNVQYGLWVCCPANYKPSVLTSSNDDLAFTSTNVEYICNNGASIPYKVWYCESAAYNASYYDKITFTTI